MPSRSHPEPAQGASHARLQVVPPGGPLAVSEIYSTHQPWMKSLLHGRIPTQLQARFDGDDVVQTAFLALCARPGSFVAGSDGEVRSFLGKVVRNGLRDEVRHHTRERRSAAHECARPDTRLEDQVCEREQPLEMIEKAERKAALLAAVARLPVEDQELVRLKYVEQRSWTEIGRALGLSETTARRRGLEALDQLMRQLW